MHASPESVSISTMADGFDGINRLLICGVNWLGDSIMTVPAVRTFRRRYPHITLALLVKPALRPFWDLCGMAREVRLLPSGAGGTFASGFFLRRERWDAAVIFPNSFRSAFIPWLAGIPRRTGYAGHGRSALLTEILPRAPSKGGVRHQSLEYADLLGVSVIPDNLQPPFMTIGEETVRAVRDKFLSNTPPDTQLYALMPGAARGPSKRWPARYFAEVGLRLLAASPGRILLFGSAGEKEVGAEVASKIGPGAIDLTGQTSLAELAALMPSCEIVIANDSGGMHLAAALGVPVVGIFGATDPRVTGPFGALSKAVTVPGIEGKRDIARDSAGARDILERLTPDRVWHDVEDLLAKGRGRRG